MWVPGAAPAYLQVVSVGGFPNLIPDPLCYRLPTSKKRTLISSNKKATNIYFNNLNSNWRETSSKKNITNEKVNKGSDSKNSIIDVNLYEEIGFDQDVLGMGILFGPYKALLTCDFPKAE